jgi:uncharacterized protein YuzE
VKYELHERQTVKLTIDPAADALYLRLNVAEIADSEQVAPGVVLDYDAQDNVVGAEMLHVSQRAGQGDLRRLLFETLGTPSLEAMTVHETPPPYGRKTR